MRTSSSLVLLCLLVAVGATNTRLKEVFAWKEVDFVFPSAEARQEAIDKKEFIAANNMPLGLDVSRDRLFITVPRWRGGVPSTLNYVRLDNETKSPALIPYPDWETNQLPGAGDNASSRVISTFRVRADACRRLWVMDTGVSDLLGLSTQHGPAKVLVYDLSTDTLLRSYALKPTDLKDDSFFANIAVDVSSDNCEDAHAYLPDLGSYSLVVYSWKRNDSWRIKHHFFHFDPLQGNYNIGGVNFQWTDGIFGISLSARHADGYRTLYFHPLSSTREFAVSTRVVQNSSIASDSYYEYKDLGSRGNNSQATASFIDERSGVMFYTQVNRNAVGCWNTNKPFSEDTQGIVAQDDNSLLFVNDLKVCSASNLWVLSDKMPLFLYRELDPEEVNYRVLKAPVPEAVKGTVCE